jgi:hypothetical protein
VHRRAVVVLLCSESTSVAHPHHLRILDCTTRLARLPEHLPVLELGEPVAEQQNGLDQHGWRADCDYLVLQEDY